MQPPNLVRRYGTAFAAVLTLLAVWVVATELIHPDLRYFPRTASEAQADAKNIATARLAAWLGWPRGQGWIDYALATNAAGLTSLANGNRPVKSDQDKTPAATAEKAAVLAPFDARAWLMLAWDELAASNNVAAQARLKMSYYTSPYRDDLFPFRIRVVAQMPGHADPELNSYAEYELRVAHQRQAPLNDDIAAAFRSASPSGRQFLEQALTKLDPTFWAALKATQP